MDNVRSFEVVTFDADVRLLRGEEELLDDVREERPDSLQNLSTFLALQADLSNDLANRSFEHMLELGEQVEALARRRLRFEDLRETRVHPLAD